MSFKTFSQIFVLIAVLIASFASTGSAQAWSGCGGSYVVQWGDTLSGIAAYCGTTVSAIYAVNPGKPDEQTNALSYTFSDAAPPAHDGKALRIQHAVANCLGARKRASMTATFDDVMLNAEAVP